MKIGFIGLGKLGLPCALAIDAIGHDVMGYDISEQVIENINNKILPYKEEGAADLLMTTHLKLGTIAEVVEHSEIIFVPIQTPHDPLYEGTTRIPDTRADFNYEYLKKGVQEIAQEAQNAQKKVILVIISTVLPGTIDREIKPLLNGFVELVYNPFFIAMGTTIADFTNPEFVLLGCDDFPDAASKVAALYQTIHNKPIFRTDIKSAELIKVSYNTFIGMKIVFANTIMEICQKIGANSDAVCLALGKATDRVISPKYLRGGMGDGGGCHPRDNIAMSWFAQELNLSHDIFYDLMKAREDQTEWLAKYIINIMSNNEMPVVILGKAYKPETNLTLGSPSILLSNILNEKGIQHLVVDPYVDTKNGDDHLHFEFPEPAIFFIGTKHHDFQIYEFPEGSIIVDPWGYMPNKDGCQVIRIGRP